MLKIEGAPKLKTSRHEIKKHIETIGFFLGVEIVVVDKELNEIARTKNENDCKKEIYKNVIDKKVIKNIKCSKNCINFSDCDVTLNVVIPMLYKKAILGAIRIYSKSEKVKKQFSENPEKYMNGISNIIQLIASRVYEEWMEVIHSERENMFVPFMDSLSNGVLLIDKDNCLIKINSFGLKELRLTPIEYEKRVTIKYVDEEKYNEKIYDVEIGENKFNLVGEIIHIGDKGKNYYTIFSFNKINRLENNFYELSKERNLTVDSMIGESKQILFMKEKIKRIAQTKSTVLITGESGTGKELVARAIHAHSERCNRPFIAINCGAIPDALLESELFGYVKGAFSGANPNGRMGKFELANEGVIFLDEIGDMPLYLQVKLLRVLQERKIVRIGSNKEIDLDIRIIAATNVDIKKKVKEKKFREDLYYRLNVIPIEVPNLKNRNKDSLLIMEGLLEKYNKALNKYVHTISDEVKEVVMKYSWPGNVRELENAIEFMVSLSDERGIITIDMVPEDILDFETNVEERLENQTKIITLEEAEKVLLKKSIKYYGVTTKGKKDAALTLGIGIATFYRKLEKYNIN